MQLTAEQISSSSILNSSKRSVPWHRLACQPVTVFPNWQISNSTQRSEYRITRKHVFRYTEIIFSFPATSYHQFFLLPSNGHSSPAGYQIAPNILDGSTIESLTTVIIGSRNTIRDVSGTRALMESRADGFVLYCLSNFLDIRGPYT